jgi:hypothetical protein
MYIQLNVRFIKSLLRTSSLQFLSVMYHHKVMGAQFSIKMLMERSLKTLSQGQVGIEG